MALKSSYRDIDDIPLADIQHYEYDARSGCWQLNIEDEPGPQGKVLEELRAIRRSIEAKDAPDEDFELAMRNPVEAMTRGHEKAQREREQRDRARERRGETAPPAQEATKPTWRYDPTMRPDDMIRLGHERGHAVDPKNAHRAWKRGEQR